MTLAFIAMGTRAAVPAGYMPAFGEDGRITVVVCSAIERQLVEIDLAEGNSAGDASFADCPFGVAQMAALPVVPFFVNAPDYDYSASVVPGDQAAPQQFRDFRRQARAPPASTA